MGPRGFTGAGEEPTVRTEVFKVLRTYALVESDETVPPLVLTVVLYRANGSVDCIVFSVRDPVIVTVFAQISCVLMKPVVLTRLAFEIATVDPVNIIEFVIPNVDAPSS